MKNINENIVKTNKNYDSIDILKFISSIFIVGLHADFLYDISPQLNIIICGGIARLGVPIFFVATSFFLFRKPLTRETVKRYCIRLIILYGCWFAISLPKTIFDRFICSKYPLGETIFRFLRSFFVTSTFSGSWFIISCIFCAILFYNINKISDKTRGVVIISLSIIVYLFSVFTSGYGKLINILHIEKYYKIYTLIFANPYNNLFTGIPYFALGYYYANISKYYNDKYKLLFIISAILLILEVIICDYFKLTKATDCRLMLLPCVLFLFPLVLKTNISFNCSKTIRKISTIVFFSQFLWLFAAELFEYISKITIPNLGKFIIAILGCFLTSYLLITLSKKKKFKYLSYFY